VDNGWFADEVPVPEASGLRPRAWICVGSGFSREDIKSVFLGAGRGFTAEAVTSLPDLAIRLTGLAADRVLTGSARQEVLRMLLANRRVASRFEELKRLRRQVSFFRRLDLAIQAGRMSFAHASEEEVYLERLHERVGPEAIRPVQREIRMLADAYEAWVRGSGLWDPPLLIREASELLDRGWPEAISRPEAIHVFSAQTEESLEKAFWEALSRHVPVIRHSPDATRGGVPDGAKLTIERWHTLDDAAERFCDELQKASPESWKHHAVLIPDYPGVRRSLTQALMRRGLPLAEPRDPGRLRWDEAIKSAVIPLSVVGRDFERREVLKWLASRGSPERTVWIPEINARAIRQGLKAYVGGGLAPLHVELSALQTRFSGRKTLAELSRLHLEHLNEAGSPSSVTSFFESFWNEFCSDLELLGMAERRAPLLYWLERLKARLAESTPPVERSKPEHGVRIFRLQQAPLEARATGPLRLWILGLPPDWLGGDSTGDFWWSARERELLASEFSVRSSVQSVSDRTGTLKAWFTVASEVTILDGEFEFDGRERESLVALLRVLGVQEPPVLTMGCHARRLSSYGATRPVPPQEIRLAPLQPKTGDARVELTATTLDRFSRCAFQGLALQRWRLWDVDDPDVELWPNVRGNILHHAVKLLLRSRDEEGRFGLLPGEALDRAWREKSPKGLFRGRRVENYVKVQLREVLEKFCAKESEFFERARTRTLSLEDLKVRLDCEGPVPFSIIGEPDRIEEHRDGLLISDYKTSSAVPNGTEMLDLGYRLQLPFYALAVKRTLKKPVIGIQFIELNRKAGRNNGIFFSRFNGKEAGKISTLRSNSKSLFTAEPDEVWSRLEEEITKQALRYLEGRFEVRPKKREKECRACPVADLCGAKRLVQQNDGEPEGA